MNEMYETKISDQRWIAYDIPGNIGWIMYVTGLALCFAKRPEFLNSPAICMQILLAVIPAALMLVGIAELISERIVKLDRVLPKKRLLRGFGALTLGGVTGMVLSVIALITDAVTVGTDYKLLIVMSVGAMLCALFSGLLYRGYQRICPTSKKSEQNADN